MTGRQNEPDALVPPGVEDSLRTEASSVPPEVGERLAAMRRQAVATVDGRAAKARLPGFFRRRELVAALCGAAVVVVAVLLVTSGGSLRELPLVTEPEVAVVQDMELLEDLEFLAWLEEESQGAG